MRYSVKLIFSPVEKNDPPLEITMPWWNARFLLDEYPFQPQKKQYLQFSLRVDLPELIRLYFEQLLHLSLQDYLLMKKDTPNETLFRQAVFSAGNYNAAVVIIEQQFVHKVAKEMSLVTSNS